MKFKNVIIGFFILTTTLCVFSKSYAQENKHDGHFEVSMRMIGHRILLDAGDSTSRVLPIKKDADRVVIQFESEFQFFPSELGVAIDSVASETGLIGGYLVEVENCETKEVVYSYEVVDSPGSDVIPCGKRMQPKDCYKLFITFYEAKDQQYLLSIETLDSGEGLIAGKRQSKSEMTNYLMIGLIILIGLFTFLWIKKRRANIDPNMISLGKYQFDKRNMRLSFEDKVVELTSKEADLLFLLHSSANSTIDREDILKSVWRDEGDYVGRTLDVFISKLRKKLEADPSVKIANIRGIGYKLVLNDTK